MVTDEIGRKTRGLHEGSAGGPDGARGDRTGIPRRWGRGARDRVRLLMAALVMMALVAAVVPLSAFASGAAPGAAPAAVANIVTPSSFTTLEGAGADRDLGAGPSKDYMTVTLSLTQQSFVRVGFTGYAFAKSSGGGVITPGCPCLVRGELRANQEARQVVTRTVLATDANDIVADPAAMPAVAAADRRDFSGSTVYSLAAGEYSFTMSLTREVGTAENVGFAFGRMQAEILPRAEAAAFATLEGAGADRDLGAGPSRDYMTVSLNVAQQSFVRVGFTGYAYGKASAAGVQTPGCPCLLRGELRANQEARQVVTRTVVSTDADDVVGDPNASPAVAAADRRDFSGSTVYSLAPGNYTFTMSVTREVGTAENVGFGFGRMQAEILPGGVQENFATLEGAGADRDLGAGPSRDYMTVQVNVAQQSFVRVVFTGYAFGKASASNTQTPGCPCLLRGELRVNEEARQIVTRAIVSTDADDVVADPAAMPAVAAADRRDFSGSHVFALGPGNYTFTMSLTREVGTAQNVGFGFGRMQADISPAPQAGGGAQPGATATRGTAPATVTRAVTPVPATAAPATIAATATPRPAGTVAAPATATVVVPGMPRTGGGGTLLGLDLAWLSVAAFGLLAIAGAAAVAARRSRAS